MTLFIYPLYVYNNVTKNAVAIHTKAQVHVIEWEPYMIPSMSKYGKFIQACQK